MQKVIKAVKDWTPSQAEQFLKIAEDSEYPPGTKTFFLDGKKEKQISRIFRCESFRGMQVVKNFYFLII